MNTHSSLPKRLEVDSTDGVLLLPVRKELPQFIFKQCSDCIYLKKKRVLRCSQKGNFFENVTWLELSLFTLAEYGKCPIKNDGTLPSDPEDSTLEYEFDDPTIRVVYD